MQETISGIRRDWRNEPALDISSDGGGGVRAAIVIPAYGQPWLTSETLHTALEQITDFDYAIVAVNDGCPLPETDEVCQTFAATHPGRIFYLRKRNGGLSAARNSGIEFALAAFPNLEAIYFLDCDNRIGPHLLQRMLDALRKAGPTAGWAYPDVNKFGFDEFADTSGHYSPLEHLFRNFCEAGSMMSRRMLDASIRFDTEMRQGVEDWEIWLHGLERGFRGVHVPDAGFAYRRRGESMLVAAERDFVPIIRYIRNRHQRLFNVRSVLEFEVEARARYAIYHPDTGQVRCFTDVTNAEVVPLEAYIGRLLRAQLRPDYGSCPGQLIIMNDSIFTTLAAQSLLAGVLWTLECALSKSSFVTCSARDRLSGDRVLEWGRDTVVQEPSQLALSGVDCHMFAIEASFLAKQVARGAADFRTLARQPDKPHHAIDLNLELASGCLEPDLQSVNGAFSRLCSDIASVGKQGYQDLWRSVAPNKYRIQTALPRDIYPDLFSLPSAFPCGSSDDNPRAALVLASATPEAVAMAARLARTLMQGGWRTDLVTFDKSLALSTLDARCFSTIVAASLPLLMSGAKARTYQGTQIPCFDPKYVNDAVSTLAGYRLAVSVDGGVSHTLMGALRRLNVETWALLGYTEVDKPTSDVVNACVAFEQAYSHIVIGNSETLSLCRAFGMPHTKVRFWSDSDEPDLQELGIEPLFARPQAVQSEIAV